MYRKSDLSDETTKMSIISLVSYLESSEHESHREHYVPKEAWQESWGYRTVKVRSPQCILPCAQQMGLLRQQYDVAPTKEQTISKDSLSICELWDTRQRTYT